MFVWKSQCANVQKLNDELKSTISGLEKRCKSLEKHIEDLQKFDNPFGMQVWCKDIELPFRVDNIETYMVGPHQDYYLQHSKFDTELYHVSVFGKNDRFIAAFNNVIAFKVIENE